MINLHMFLYYLMSNYNFIVINHKRCLYSPTVKISCIKRTFFLHKIKYYSKKDNSFKTIG